MTFENLLRALVIVMGFVAAGFLSALSISLRSRLSGGAKIGRLGAVGVFLCVSWGSIAVALDLPAEYRLTPMVLSLSYVAYGSSVELKEIRKRRGRRPR